MSSKIYVVKQNDLCDCGIACLLSIIKYYNGYIPMEKLRIDTNTTREGTTAFNLINAAKKYGFDAAGYYYSNKVLDNNILYPAIAHMNINGLEHFIVIYKYYKNQLLIMDPAKGKSKINIKEFTKLWTGNILVFSINSPIAYLKKENTLLNIFITYIKVNKNVFIIIIITNFMLLLFSLVSSYFFKIGIENINNKIRLIIIMFSLITLFKCIFNYLKNYYINYFEKNLEVDILKDFINHLFNLPSRVIQSRTVGEIMNRFTELSNIKNSFSDLFISFFLDFLLTIITMPIMFMISQKLFMILLLFLVMYLIVGIIYSKILYKKIIQTIEYEDIINSALVENISAYDSIKNLNITNSFLTQIEQKNSNYILDTFKMNKKINNQESIKYTLNEMCFFLINSCGFYLIIINKLSMVDLVLFNTLINFFLDPLKNLINSLPKYNFLKASYNKINEFISIPEIATDKENVNIENYNISIKNLSYSYDGYKKIFKNFNLEIKEHVKLFLCGNSGCGKSTLCKIISGNELDFNGDIYIGNINYKDLTIYNIKKYIVYVSQNEKLFTDTIKNNILLFRNINYEKYQKTCDICFINQIIDKKPLRFETVIKTNSNNFSGGEKQRIVLARSLLNDFNVLIIDEALSEIDMKLESKIIKNLILYFKDKTIIYVSHKNHKKLFDKVIKVSDENE